MRILENKHVEEVIRIDDCLDGLEVAYREYARGEGANVPRNHTYFPVDHPDHPGFRYRFKSQEGGNVSSGVWALRITSDVAGVEKMPSGHERRRLLPVAPGEQYVGYFTLYDLKTVQPLAIIHDSVVQKMRVAATTALGIRELANPDVVTAGLFGAGWQAEAHLQFLLEVRPSVEEVRVFSPTPESRQAFADEWDGKLDISVIAVDEPRKAVEDCGIVITATAAMDPVFDGNWIEPGTHVTSITSPDGTSPRRELDDTTFDRADILHVHSIDQVHHDNQFDILGPVERGLRDLDSIKGLGDLLEGNAETRTSSDQISVFANNTGMGLQFAAVGSKILERAEEADIGHEIPTDWLLEETTP